MALLALGLNHQSAPIAVREKMAFLPQQTREALKELLKQGAVNEAMILSTCNRVELYSLTDNQSTFYEWLTQHLKSNPKDSAYWYLHEEQKAVAHIMRVASGLDSMVLGETQILGQMKDAYKLACEVGSIGTQFQRLFQNVFSVTKTVRSDTKISAHPISLGYSVVNLAKRIFSDLSKKSVLLIGTGEIIELAAMHLFNQGVKNIVVANRSLDKAERFAKRYYGHWIALADVPIYLKETDIVVTGTSSELPILGKGAVEQAIKARKHKPILMVDLGVPRDIEPEVSQLEDVYLYNIDDMKEIIEENVKSRQSAAQEAEMIIEMKASRFMKELKSLDANATICEYRTKLETFSQYELQNALKKLEMGGEPDQVLMQFAHNLLNKVMHGPSTQLRFAAFDGRLDLISYARKLLDI